MFAFKYIYFIRGILSAVTDYLIKPNLGKKTFNFQKTVKKHFVQKFRFWCENRCRPTENKFSICKNSLKKSVFRWFLHMKVLYRHSYLFFFNWSFFEFVDKKKYTWRMNTCHRQPHHPHHHNTYTKYSIHIFVFVQIFSMLFAAKSFRLE